MSYNTNWSIRISIYSKCKYSFITLTGEQFESGGKVYDIVSSELNFTFSNSKIVDAKGDEVKEAHDASSDKGYYVVDKSKGVIEVYDAEAH